jgi:hypothetical protein
MGEWERMEKKNGEKNGGQRRRMPGIEGLAQRLTTAGL